MIKSIVRAVRQHCPLTSYAVCARRHSSKTNEGEESHENANLFLPALFPH